MADRGALRLPATLVAAGLLLYLLSTFAETTIGTLLSTGNDHTAELTAIADGRNWPTVALVQFLATAIVTTGLLALYYALNYAPNTTDEVPVWTNWAKRFGAVAAMVSLALAGVVYAVDGVALKQAAAVWAHAPATEKAARFATAEGIVWLEWGIRSYNSFVFGVALALFAVAIVWTARTIRPIGYFMGLHGIATLVLGWQTGAEGFSSYTSGTYYTSGGLFLVWSVWLLIIAWQKPQMAVPAASGQAIAVSKPAATAGRTNDEEGGS
jgi:hypothetical protein